MRILCTAIALLFASSLAHAQDLPEEPVATTAAQANGLTDGQERRLARARASGTAGLVLGGLATGAGGTALAWDGAVLPQKIVAGSSILVYGIAVPVGFSGGAKARRVATSAGAEPPSLALPLVAWGAWLGAMGTGAYQAATGSDAGALRPGLTAVTTTLGAASAIAMGVDAHMTIAKVEDTVGTATAADSGRYKPHFALVYMPLPSGSMFALAANF